ncbi:MAG: amino acid amidase [Spirochaetaceae bacterium]|nr:MAG: amino acid amidase [Spirochaetaceae bacterium]
MKRLYVSVDIEGICGIADWTETRIDDAQGAYFRREMTLEAAALCRAACDAGVDDIVVKDAHDSGRSIDPSLLPEQASLIRAWTRDPYSMMAGLDESFIGACYLGYHSEAGSDGNPLAHTLNTNSQRIQVNGLPASELLLNAYTASSFGVPSLVLSGDSALCESALTIAPNLRTVAVFEGIGAATRSVHPARAQRAIADAVSDALAADPTDMIVALPDRFDVSIEFVSTRHAMARRASFYPGATRDGACGVLFAATRWIDVLAFLQFVL